MVRNKKVQVELELWQLTIETNLFPEELIYFCISSI